MKIFRIKINSSVVVVNGGVLLVVLGSLLVGWLTDNQEMMKAILSPTQLLILSGVQSALTIWLRTTNTQGKKPVEVLSKDSDVEDK